MKKVGLDLDGVVYDFVTEYDRFLKLNGYKIDERDYYRGIKKNDAKELLKEFYKTRPFCSNMF